MSAGSMALVVAVGFLNTMYTPGADAKPDNDHRCGQGQRAHYPDAQPTGSDQPNGKQPGPDKNNNANEQKYKRAALFIRMFEQPQEKSVQRIPCPPEGGEAQLRDVGLTYPLCRVVGIGAFVALAHFALLLSCR